MLKGGDESLRPTSKRVKGKGRRMGYPLFLSRGKITKCGNHRIRRRCKLHEGCIKFLMLLKRNKTISFFLLFVLGGIGRRFFGGWGNENGDEKKT